MVGGKAWSIHWIQALNVPVPPAFVISSEVCVDFHRMGGRLPEYTLIELRGAMRWLERVTGQTFGGGERPLLVSVRSGAAVSMPGMMDTVLNLGMTDDVEHALGVATGHPAFASDLRNRFDQNYREVVGRTAPNSSWDQLRGAITAVLMSWNSTRAVAYRRDRQLRETGGTAVTVQAMVFGNADKRSGTGVLFSRDPIDGSSTPYGEWLQQGQGEDVVSGRHMPKPLDALAQDMPEVHAELLSHSRRLERANLDAQDIEFTVERGRLWLLQSRSAKRSPAAAVRLAVAFVNEGLITPRQALDRVSAEQIEQLQRPQLDPSALRAAKRLASGKLACPGTVTGTIVTGVVEAERRAHAGESILLARKTTEPDDVHAMSVVAGVMTELGGSTSHAAVVSREIGVPCIVGCGVGSLSPFDQQVATLHADAGDVYHGALPLIAVDASLHPSIAQLETWARVEASDTGKSWTLTKLLRERCTKER
jgi:pyruvate,orthophosphate dikinase